MEGQEKQIAIITASAADAKALADLFIGHITAHPEYISHGEIQMGVGVGAVQGDRFITCPAPDARERWMRYILSEMSNDAIAHVWKAVDAQGTLMGFCVADIEGNEDCPFGMVGDVLVNPQCRALVWAIPFFRRPSTGCAQRGFRRFIWNPERTTMAPTVSLKNAGSSMSVRCID